MLWVEGEVEWSVGGSGVIGEHHVPCKLAVLLNRVPAHSRRQTQACAPAYFTLQ